MALESLEDTPSHIRGVLSVDSACPKLTEGFLHAAMAIPKQRQLRQFRIAGQAECEQKCSGAERK
jgi:hypothetical protein